MITKTYKDFIDEARRMKVLRTSHYTSKEGKDSILRSGFRESPSSGTYHPEGGKRTVYTTPSHKVGKDYGRHRVNLSIVNPNVTNVNSYANYRNQKRDIVNNAKPGEEIGDRIRSLSPIHQAKSAIEQGHKVVRVSDAHRAGAKAGKGSYIMVDIDTANRSISRKPSPLIRLNKKSRFKNK
jgi:hypothetical protein